MLSKEPPRAAQVRRRLLGWSLFSLGVHLALVLLVAFAVPPLFTSPGWRVHEVELTDPGGLPAAALLQFGPVPSAAGGPAGGGKSRRSGPPGEDSARSARPVGRAGALSGGRRGPGGLAAESEPTPFLERFAAAPGSEVPAQGPGAALLTRIGKDGATALQEGADPRGESGRRAREGGSDNPQGWGGAGRGGGAGAGPGFGAGRGTRQALWLNRPGPGYETYFRRIYQKVDRLWQFPKALELVFEQGDVLVQFTIVADGSVSEVQLRKSSGFAEFDQNVLAAIRKAAPFGPIPRGLGRSLRVLAPFEFANPMVR